MGAGTGDDTLYGGNGADTLTGGGGVDTMEGGAGIDRFTFTAISDAASGTPDTITDFDANSDLLVFSGLLTGTFSFVGAHFNDTSNAKASNVQISPQPIQVRSDFATHAWLSVHPSKTQN